MMIKFGTQVSTFGKADLREALQFVRQMGCQGLEVSMNVGSLRTGTVALEALLSQAQTLRSAFSEADMEVISLTPSIWLKHVQTPAVIEAVCQGARTLGARQIRTFFAPYVRLGGSNSALDEWHAEFDGTRDSRYWMKRNCEELQMLLDMTKCSGLRFVFELHHGFSVTSASAAMRILEHFPPSRVGIIMDPGNMVFEGNEGWRNSVQIMGEYLAYIHCKNAAWRRENGRWVQAWESLEDGIADYGEIVTALKDIGFDGYLCIEDLRGGLTPEERIGKAIRYLKGLIESDRRVMPI
jgi:sugar phosphate isomerase/epimerase